MLLWHPKTSLVFAHTCLPCFIYANTFAFLPRDIDIFLSDSPSSLPCSESALWLAFGPFFSQLKKQAMERHTPLPWHSCGQDSWGCWWAALLLPISAGRRSWWLCLTLLLLCRRFRQCFAKQKLIRNYFCFDFLSHCFIHLLGCFCPSG